MYQLLKSIRIFVKAIFGIGQTKNWITLMWTNKITIQNQYVQIEKRISNTKIGTKTKIKCFLGQNDQKSNQIGENYIF